MASKAFEQICRYLDDKDMRYDTDEEGTDAEKIYFGANGLVQQKFLFIVESEANVVQFRSIQILDEEDLEIYRCNADNRVKLYEYLLKCNYDWKLGKFALDPEDEDVDLYFVISNHVDVGKGIDEELIDVAWAMLWGSALASAPVEIAIRDIKSILATGEKSDLEELESEDGINADQLMEGMLAKIAQGDNEVAKAILGDPNAPEELKEIVRVQLGNSASGDGRTGI